MSTHEAVLSDIGRRLTELSGEINAISRRLDAVEQRLDRIADQLRPGQKTQQEDDDREIH